MCARGKREEEHPESDIYRQWPPQTLLYIALWHQPSYWTHRGRQQLPFNCTRVRVQSQFTFSVLISGSLGVQYLFAHFTLRWHQLCDRLRVTPTSQSCTNVPDGNPQAAELIKQEKAPRIIYQSDSGAQAEQLTCCSPFIWRCGCCFHAS